MSVAIAVRERFRLIRLDLAREPGHPQGSRLDRYALVLPLLPDGRIDRGECQAHPEFCRVTRRSAQGEEAHGLIHRDADGAWIFDYGQAGPGPDVVFRLTEERFAPGEYVSVRRDDGEHAYRVISLQPL